MKIVFKWYRIAKAGLLGETCRFYPTCSFYAEEAIEKYGIFKGIRLAISRLSRCNQFNPGGFDPVP